MTLGEGVPVEGCDHGADMPDTFSGAIWRQHIADHLCQGVRSRLTVSEADAMVHPITVAP